MVQRADEYTYQVTWSQEDREFVGLCAEFPSLSWLDKAPDAALRGIRRIVRDCVADMANNNEQIPEPKVSGISGASAVHA